MNAPLSTEQLASLVRGLYRLGQFWHEDANRSRVICNCCGESCFDDADQIVHRPGCIILKAREVVKSQRELGDPPVHCIGSFTT